jgi:hypothetical protein
MQLDFSFRLCGLMEGTIFYQVCDEAVVEKVSDPSPLLRGKSNRHIEVITRYGSA